MKVRWAPRLDRTIGRATFAEADPMREAILGATRAAIVLDVCEVDSKNEVFGDRYVWVEMEDFECWQSKEVLLLGVGGKEWEGRKEKQEKLS